MPPALNGVKVIGCAEHNWVAMRKKNSEETMPAVECVRTLMRNPHSTKSDYFNGGWPIALRETAVP
jgi:hypothetical protein